MSNPLDNTGKPVELPKPPLGLMPRVDWEYQRVWEIVRALNRYDQAGKVPPIAWWKELREHLDAHHQYGLE